MSNNTTHQPAICSHCRADGHIWAGADPKKVKCSECERVGTLIPKAGKDTPEELAELRENVDIAFAKIFEVSQEEAHAILLEVEMSPDEARPLVLASAQTWHEFMSRKLIAEFRAHLGRRGSDEHDNPWERADRDDNS